MLHFIKFLSAFSDKASETAHTKERKKEGVLYMKKFTTGMLLGGAMTMAGLGYMMQDQRRYQKVMKKGKKMAVKAEEVMDDIMDDLMP